MQIIVVVAGLFFTGLAVYAFANYGGLENEDVVAVADQSTADLPESETEEDMATVANRRRRDSRVRERHRKRVRPRPSARRTASNDPEADQRAREQKKRKQEAAIQQEMRRVPIKMYMTRWCPVCTKARLWLGANRYQFTEYDVEANRGARRTQKRLNPRGSIPTFDIDGEVRVGFSASRLKGILRRQARRRLGL